MSVCAFGFGYFISVTSVSSRRKSTPRHFYCRFIPNRSNLDLETSHHLLLNTENMDPVTGCMSPNSADLRRKMSEALNNGQVPSDAKILSFKQKAPVAKEGIV